jgi:hypothetical protein
MALLKPAQGYKPSRLVPFLLVLVCPYFLWLMHVSSSGWNMFIPELVVQF